MALPIDNNPLSLYFRSQVDYTPTARPTIKVKLAPVGKTPNSAAANEIVEDWKAERMASRNLTQAIILYQSLREGDPTVLLDEFPWLANLFVAPSTPQITQPQPDRAQRFDAPVIIEDMDDETLGDNSVAQVGDFLGDFDL